MFKVKPDIENFLNTILLRNSEFIPLAELGIHPAIKQKFIGREIRNIQDDIEFWYKAGYDYIKLQPSADFNPMKIGVGDKLTFNDDGTVFRKWASEGKGVISSMSDLENYVFPSKSDIDYSNVDKIKSFLPEGMGVVAQYGDIFTMTWEMMGFETFSLALFEEPELIDLLNNTIGDLILSMFEYFVQSENVNAIWYSDDIAYTNGLLVSPDVLDKYFFPWLKQIGDLSKKYNKPLIYHSDGILFDVFDKIIACGVNAIHPIEPKAMDIKEVKKRYGDKLCLIGNIDVDLLSRGTEEEVRKVVLNNIESAGMNGGYCAGSGNSIPEYVKFENYLAMIMTVKEFNNQTN
ncbi:MAG: uroporphyrinogen decarboxylase family protein [Ignavibacteriaceae bacterium]